MKKSWLDPSAHNKMFSRLLPVRGVILNQWEAERAIMPERSYKSPKGKPPIRYTSTHCNFFPAYPIEGYSRDFQEKLKRDIKKHKETVKRSVTHDVKAKTPRLLDPNFRGITFDKVSRYFGWGKNTSWEGFEKIFLGKLRPDLSLKSQSAMQTPRITLH